jgi:hypothetical protein
MEYLRWWIFGILIWNILITAWMLGITSGLMSATKMMDKLAAYLEKLLEDQKKGVGEDYISGSHYPTTEEARKQLLEITHKMCVEDELKRERTK